ncbi:sensor histidine kinase [Paenibacillus luteus]|uniref:sensor histidine kinase n=1 Tax=Paenibacillus luteus TaxID=2545753 RepID=UPI0011447F30|nr:histidine kinase [Paenibacillus luteus]
MKGFLKNWSWRSIRSRLAISVLAVTLPLIALLLYNSFYSINVVRNQVASSNKNMLILYMDQIDKNLEDVDQYLNNLVAIDTDLLVMGLPAPDQEYEMAKLSLFSKLQEKIPLFKTIDAFFVYSLSRQDYVSAFRQVGTFAERAAVQAYLAGILRGGPDGEAIGSKRWYVKEINGTYYLFHIFKSGDSYIGSWINTNRLVGALGLIDLGEKGRSLLTTDQGIPLTEKAYIKENGIDLNRSLDNYYLTGSSSRYMVVGSESSKGNINLIAMIPDEKILEKLPYLRKIILFVSICSLIILPVGTLLLRKMILIPLNRILMVMKRIKEGNLDVRINQSAGVDEFQIVNETFNTMMAQIQQLHVNVYQEQLSKQKAELQHLQLQINPHFFMNSLNIIYSLAQTQNYTLIQELSLCLVTYFRYMFRTNLSFVQLKQELDHTRNYIRIQELRYPDSLIGRIEVPDFLLSASVPPLFIQSFVENTVKHAMTMDGFIEIIILVDLWDEDGKPYVRAVIEDSGRGFPEEVVNKLNEGGKMTNEQGEHIGIWNVQQRLSLLYNGQADISFSNRTEGGARVVILLPLHENNS